jgi:acyl-coenzyme A thioesterase PaaI-like protein
MWQRINNIISSSSSVKPLIPFLLTIAISTNIVVNDALSLQSSSSLLASSASRIAPVVVRCDTTSTTTSTTTRQRPESLMKYQQDSLSSKTILYGSKTLENNNGEDDNDNDNERTQVKRSSSLPTTTHHNNYERMKTPVRGAMKEHAIFGALNRDSMIEKYEIWKQKPRLQQQQTNDNDIGIGIDNVVIGYVKFGDNLNGHIGIVHGGIISLLFDDICGFAFDALGIKHAVTANLNVNYRKPLLANTEVYLEVQFDKMKSKGRKLYFNVQMKSTNTKTTSTTSSAIDDNDADNNDDETILYAEATCLYIIPRDHL